jgi:transcriptional regulator GlxA family with amidase domain
MMTNEQSEKLIAFVLYPGLTPLDMVGPLQVLTGLSALAPQYRTVVVGERIEPMDSDIHVQLLPDRTFDAVPHPFALIVPGGGVPTLRAMNNAAIRQYVRTAAETAEVVGSVCTGALILAAVGLLKGRQATTHWAFAKVLEHLGATYHRKRWVEDGKYITAAGVSAGIDMALRLAARLTDEATARQVQLGIEYDPQPPFGRIDWDHMGLLPRTMRAGVTLAAPFLAYQPKRMISQGR